MPPQCGEGGLQEQRSMYMDTRVNSRQTNITQPRVSLRSLGSTSDHSMSVLLREVRYKLAPEMWG